jgi:hypothetical protein
MYFVVMKKHPLTRTSIKEQARTSAPAKAPTSAPKFTFIELSLSSKTKIVTLAKIVTMDKMLQIPADRIKMLLSRQNVTKRHIHNFVDFSTRIWIFMLNVFCLGKYRAIVTVANKGLT